MKITITTAAIALVMASHMAAQADPKTTFGGGMSIKVHSTKGTKTVRDTTAHTTLSDGTTVSTSTDNNDGQTPNGGGGEGGGENSGGEK